MTKKLLLEIGVVTISQPSKDGARRLMVRGVVMEDGLEGHRVPPRGLVRFTIRRGGTTLPIVEAAGLRSGNQLMAEAVVSFTPGRYLIQGELQGSDHSNVRGQSVLEIPSPEAARTITRCAHHGQSSRYDGISFFQRGQPDPSVIWWRNHLAPCCYPAGAMLGRVRKFSLSFITVNRPLQLVVGQKRLRLTPTRYLIVPPSEAAIVIGETARRGTEVQWLLIRQPVLREIRDELGLVKTLGPFGFEVEDRPLTPELRGWLGQLQEALRHPRAFGGERLVAHLIGVGLIYLLKSHPNPLQEAASRRDGFHPQVAKVLAWLDAHLHQSVTLASMARDIHVTYGHLRSLFRRETGRPVRQELAIRRVAKAEQLLRNPEAKVEDVARQVGFADGKSLHRAFRRVRGLAPSSARPSR